MTFVITQFWDIPQKFIYLFAGNVEKAGREIKLQFLEKIQG
jgi:hypothetical protein